MGESKHRKQRDPNYGKPKIRGLIISSPIRIDGDNFQIQGGLDDQDLRASLLYWDRLLWPTNPQLHTGAGQTEAFLVAAGILSRPMIQHAGGLGEEIILSSQSAAFLQMQAKEPEIWSMNCGENSIHIESELETLNNGTLLELFNSLPVPGPQVPLAEILEFKHKRREELLAFRAHFENLATRIESAADSEDELQIATLEVDKACANLLKTTRELRFPVFLTDVKAYFNFDLNKALDAASKVYDLGMKSNLDQTSVIVSSSVAAIASQFKLSSTYGFRSMRLPSSPYKYAYNVQQQLK